MRIAGEDAVALGSDFDGFVPLPRGSVIECWNGGGGGFGDPLRRPLEQVLAELRDGTLGVEKARAEYGVVVDPETFALDEPATAALHAHLARRIDAL